MSGFARPRNRTSRRRVRLADWARSSRVAAAIAFAQAACSSQAPGETSDGAERSGDAAAVQGLLDDGPRERVVVAVRSLPAAFDPFSPLDPWSRRIADDLLFEGLTRRSSSGAPWHTLALAEECHTDLQSKSTVVHCRLRTGRMFHDGAPVTPEDALYSIARWTRSNAHALRARNGLSSLREVTLVERIPAPAGAKTSPEADSTGAEDGASADAAREQLEGPWLRLRFDRAEPLALERIAAIKIVPKASYAGHVSEFARAPVGSGPMKLAFLGDGRLVLEAAQAPSDPRRPDRVVFRAIADGAQALTLARRGEVHIVASLAPLHVPDELAKPGMAARFHALVLSPSRYDLVIYNTRRGATADGELRAALDGVLPRETVASELYRRPALETGAPVDLLTPIELDLAALAGGDLEAARLVPPWTVERPSVAALEQRAAARREAANAALDAVGWPLDRGLRRRGSNGLRIPLMWDGAKGHGAAITSAVRSAWREVGVQAPNVTASWGYLRQKPIREGSFDAVLARLATASDADLYPYFHSHGRLNFAGVRDDALDQALTDYRDATTPAQRDAARQTIAERIEALRVVSVLYAPLEVMLLTRALEPPAFIDDLPRLDRLRFRG